MDGRGGSTGRVGASKELLRYRWRRVVLNLGETDTSSWDSETGDSGRAIIKHYNPCL